MDDRDWVFNGTRFVSPVSSDAAAVMLFDSCGVAESVAGHLRARSVATGIKAKRVNWGILKNTTLPAIAGFLPPTEAESHAAKAREKRHYNLRALSLSAQRALDAEEEKLET